MHDTPQMHDSAGTPPEWIEQLDALLPLLSDESHAGDEVEFLHRLTALDPNLLAFLIESIAEQDSPQAATLLELLAAQPETSESLRERARTARNAMADRGIVPTPPGEERFYSAWVQQGRERGEQILLLGWRMPSGAVEALVFLLDWQGDGLKDFYRTRDMQESEWRELLAHNGEKGAPLVEITLPQARALVEAGLAESRRFSRPTPREYKLESRLVERRVLEAGGPSQAVDQLATQEALIGAHLTPEDVVRAYAAALHHRDYVLAILLLAPEHSLRAGHTLPDALEGLRAHMKHTPRREEAVQVAVVGEPVDSDEGTVTVETRGAEVTVERTGRRVRSDVHERYLLRQSDGGWRILRITPL